MRLLIGLLLTFLTGFSGLVYEVSWQKYLAILLGSHGEATAAVLGIFLGGLAAGYAVFGAVTRRGVERSRRRREPPRLLLLYGAVEVGIGAYALAFPWLFSAAVATSLRLAPGAPAAAFGFDVVLTAALVGPPALLMGGTIPILTQALSRDVAESSRIHAWIYGSNTAGAFLGALAGAVLLVPALGLDGTVRAMGLVNLLAGSSFLVMDRFVPATRLEEATAASRPAAVAFVPFAVVALLAGFAMMTLQVVLNRVGGLAFGTSHFTFGIVVAAFVLCIALGSFVVSSLPRIRPGWIVGSQWALVASLTVIYLLVPEAPLWVHWVRGHFGSAGSDFLPYHAVGFAGALGIFAIPIGLSGALLPLLFHHLRGQLVDLGAVAGRLYGWNTLGSLLGALVGGFLLLFWLDLHQVYRVAVSALALGSAILTVRVLGPRWRPAAALLAAGALSLVWLLPVWAPAKLASGLFRFHGPMALDAPKSIVFYEDDPVLSVAVRRVHMRDGRTNQSIVTDGKSEGALIGDYATMALVGLVPAAFSDDPSRCFVIGLGTGVTAGELGSLPEVESVRVAEISSSVVRAAPLFDFGNQGASQNPKVEVVRTDAYRALLHEDRRYGVIVSEPSNPWRMGVEMLYSREFLEAARDRLTPGGVYGQWLHLYESDEGVVELVLRTYDQVFDDVSVWFTQTSDVLLLGFRSPSGARDLDHLEARFEAWRPAFERAGVRSFVGLLAHEILPLDVVHAARLEGDVHTLRHPILSDRAARAFFVGRRARLPLLVARRSAAVGADSSLLRRFALRDGRWDEDELAESAVAVCEGGQLHECATLVAWWGVLAPHAPRLAELRSLLKRRQTTASLLGVRRLAVLRSLLVPGSALADGRDAAALERSSEWYADHYFHALPFDRETLEAAWADCAASPSEEAGCEQACQRAEARLGELPAPPCPR